MKSIHISTDKRIICLIFLIAIILKIPALSVPYFEDAKFWRVPRALLISQNFLNLNRSSNIPKELDIQFEKRHPWLSYQVENVGHPPLFYWILASSYFLFGHSLFVSHSVIIVISALCLCFTYLLALHLTKKDRLASIASCALLFVSPVYFSQTETLNFSVILTTLCVICVYFYFCDNLLLYSLSASLMMLTKEFGILIVIPILFHFVFIRKKEGSFFLGLFYCVLPLIVFFIWLFVHHLEVGWWFYPYHVSSFLKQSPITKIIYIFNFHFIGQYRFILTSFVCIVLFQKNIRRKFFSSEIISLIVLILIFITPFSLFSFSARPRYSLAIYPFLFIIFCFAIRNILTDKRLYTFTVVVFILLSISQWHALTTENLEENLRFVDILNTKKQTIAFLKKNYPKARVWAGGFFYADLVYPYVGYESHSLDAQLLMNKDILAGIRNTKEYAQTFRKGDIILESLYPEWVQKENRTIYKDVKTQLIKTFKIRQDYVNIYYVTQPYVVRFSWSKEAK